MVSAVFDLLMRPKYNGLDSTKGDGVAALFEWLASLR